MKDVQNITENKKGKLQMNNRKQQFFDELLSFELPQKFYQEHPISTKLIFQLDLKSHEKRDPFQQI